MPPSDQPKPNPENPVVEPSPAGAPPPVNEQALELRIRQQELLAQLGVVALQRTPFRELLDRAVQLAAEGLKADFCKILEYVPQENQFVLRAGVGWEPDLIDVARVGADLASPSGYALRTGKPVISNHLENEERFRTPDLLKAHGVRRAINVILQGENAPYGVLEVDSQSEGEFSEQDIAFLQGAANILGMAIERQRYELNLCRALERQKVLMDEINHRVKNSLQLVASLFGLQAAATQDPILAQGLQAAMSRVSAIARIHERLYKDGDVTTVDLTDYLADVCKDLAGLLTHMDIRFSANGPVYIGTDRAVQIALFATELVTNAAKHAYAGETGTAWVELALSPDDTIALSVRDEGKGLPSEFDVNQSSGFGVKIIGNLVKDLGGTLTIRRRQPGTEFCIQVPVSEDGGP